MTTEQIRVLFIAQFARATDQGSRPGQPHCTVRDLLPEREYGFCAVRCAETPETAASAIEQMGSWYNPKAIFVASSFGIRYLHGVFGNDRLFQTVVGKETRQARLPTVILRLKEDTPDPEIKEKMRQLIEGGVQEVVWTKEDLTANVHGRMRAVMEAAQISLR